MEWSEANLLSVHDGLGHHGFDSRYERALRESRGSSNEILAEVSKLTRRAWRAKVGSEAIATVLAGVAGPMLCGFTTWMLQNARSAGLERLYFLSREGQLLYELATIVNEHFQLGLELKYLFVSRHALNLVLLTEPDDLELLFATTGTKNYTVNGLLHRLGLEPDELASHLQDIGLPETSWNIALSDVQRVRLFGMLQSGAPRKARASNASRVRQLAEGYLAAEGVFDDVPIGLVDTAGIGTQLRTLNRLRVPRPDARTAGYLIVRNWRQEMLDAGFPPIQAFLADQTVSPITWMPAVIAMLEVFARADHGTVIGYCEYGGMFEPVLQADGFGRRGLACDPAMIRAVLRSFVTEFVIRAGRFEANADCCDGVVNAFHAFWNDPTPEEADAWGRFQFEYGPRNKVTVSELAPRLRLSDLIAVKLGKKPYRSHWFSWRIGSERRSTWHIRALVQCGRFIKGLFNQSRRRKESPQASQGDRSQAASDAVSHANLASTNAPRTVTGDTAL
jgi:hypothetical protein